MSRRSELAAFLPGAPAPRARRRRGELTPEGQLLRDVKAYLAVHGVPTWRCSVGAFRIEGRYIRMGDAGLPDLIALVPGVGAVFVELKSARGRLAVDQARFRNAAQAAGAVHVVCRHIQDLDPWLPRHGKGR